MTIAEFYKTLFGSDEKHKNYESNTTPILINEKYIERIVEYLKIIEEDKRKSYFKDIVNKPQMDNGKVYEILLYAWLYKKKVIFNDQIAILESECLKENNYIADGTFEGIVFDVKKFGIGFPNYDIFRDKLQKLIPDYYITVGGGKNLDTQILKKEFLEKADMWKQKLLSEESKLFDDYRLYIPEYDIEIRAHNKKSNNGIYTSISEIDVTKWAAENELFFFRHASQFCTNKPYMLICPFVPTDVPFGNDNDMSVYYAFRFLCRRMFMNVLKQENKLLKNTCDGHAKENITLGEASRKLSGVMFLDISEEWNYNNCRCWIYINPNADMPIPNYVIHSVFHCLGAYTDDFQYDNY